MAPDSPETRDQSDFHQVSNTNAELNSLMNPELNSSPSESPPPPGYLPPESPPGSPPPTNGVPIPQPPPKPRPPRRQSSFAQPRPHGAPRTPNRVRFDFSDTSRTVNGSTNPRWVDEEDPLGGENEDHDLDGSLDQGQRLPLLTGVEAPSVSVAGGQFEINPEEHLENARPRSGMQSAFMNMANSIM